MQKKQFIELLLIESETVTAKIQLEVDQSIDPLFPDESQDIRIALEGTNREMKKVVINRGTWRTSYQYQGKP